MNINLDSINNACHIPSVGCYILQDYFTPDLLKEVKKVFNDRSLDWRKGYMQENWNRWQLWWENPIHDILRTVADSPSVIEAINSKLERPVKFNDLSLWHDYDGLKLSLHVDNESYNVGIQIYITDSIHYGLGTSIADANNRVLFTLPYRDNMGYFLTNANKTPHGVMTPVPEGFNRYSILFRYSYI